MKKYFLPLVITNDYGMDEKADKYNGYNNWYSPVLIIKVNFNDKWSFTGRGEFYNDKNRVILPIGTENGFQTSGRRNIC